jgi:hypothetical protein
MSNERNIPSLKYVKFLDVNLNIHYTQIIETNKAKFLTTITKGLVPTLEPNIKLQHLISPPQRTVYLHNDSHKPRS